MQGITESCSVCSRTYEVQFKYQMEEQAGGFVFFCSQACQSKSARGEIEGGVTCDGCGKRFVVELVSQMIKAPGGKGARRYACSDPCRAQVLLEVNGARLGSMTAPHVPPAPASSPSPQASVDEPAPPSVDHAPPSRTSAPASTRKLPDRVRTPVDVHGPRRLAIFNHKGGTGKTTTSVSIAAGLAMRGARVLLVDTDSQGNVAVSLGVKAERSLYHVLVMGLRAESAVVPVRPNLDLIVSNETLAAAELYLAGRQNRDRILRDRLSPLFDAYDVVVLDCSPSLSLMNQNALVTADGVLVPVACDFLSLVGVRQVIKTVKNVNALLHHPVQIYGVLPTFYDARARICRDAVDTMKEHFGDRCLAPIRSTIKIKEAPAQGKTIFEYADGSHAALDYLAVVDRLLSGARSSAPETYEQDGHLEEAQASA
jgi:chromosome partitioning protein